MVFSNLSNVSYNIDIEKEEETDEKKGEKYERKMLLDELY